MKDRLQNQRRAGAMLRGQRERLEMRQSDLADHANISLRSLQRLESGQIRDPRVSTLGAVIRQLELSQRTANYVLRAWAGV